jgi:hypothetical protein
VSTLGQVHDSLLCCCCDSAGEPIDTGAALVTLLSCTITVLLHTTDTACLNSLIVWHFSKFYLCVPRGTSPAGLLTLTRCCWSFI